MYNPSSSSTSSPSPYSSSSSSIASTLPLIHYSPLVLPFSHCPISHVNHTTILNTPSVVLHSLYPSFNTPPFPLTSPTLSSYHQQKYYHRHNMLQQQQQIFHP